MMFEGLRDPLFDPSFRPFFSACFSSYKEPNLGQRWAASFSRAAVLPLCQARVRATICRTVHSSVRRWSVGRSVGGFSSKRDATRNKRTLCPSERRGERERERKREREGEREMECPRGKREQREPGSSIDRLLSSSIPATEP